MKKQLTGAWPVFLLAVSLGVAPAGSARRNPGSGLVSGMIAVARADDHAPAVTADTAGPRTSAPPAPNTGAPTPAAAPGASPPGVEWVPPAAGAAGDSESKILAQTRAYNAGLEALKKNDLGGAGDSFQQAVTLVAADASAQLFLGYVRLKQERYDDALAALEAANRLSAQLDVKSRAVVHNNLGLVYWNKNRGVDAIAAYLSALQLDKELTDARYNLAFALLAQKRYAEALPHFTQLIGQDQHDAALYDGLGEAYENTGVWGKALTAYKKAIELDPRNSYYPLRVAMVLESTGRKEDAVQYLREATRLDPQNSDAFLHLGDYYIQRGRWSEAQDALSRYVALRPNDFLGWYNLGVAYDFASKFDDALRAYAEAERLKPQDASVKNNVGRILYKRGRLDEAAAQCQKALELDKDFNDARYNLALVLTAQNKLPEANTQWKTLIDNAARDLGKPLPVKQRRDARALLIAARAALAESFLKAESYADAASEYQRLLELDPGNIPAMSNRALALYHTRDLKQAAIIYREIIKRDGNNAIAYNNLGVMLEAQSDRAGALENYRRAVKLKPDYAEAKSNIERLTQNTTIG